MQNRDMKTVNVALQFVIWTEILINATVILYRMCVSKCLRAVLISQTSRHVTYGKWSSNGFDLKTLTQIA